MKLDDDGEYGYAYEVDIRIPAYLHDYMNDLPPFCTSRKVDISELSEDQILARLGFNETMDQIKSSLNQSERLVSSLNPLTKHLCHYRKLKFLIKEGCIVDKVHSIIQFKQTNLYKDYMEACTKFRAESKTESARLFFKNTANMPFGKTMESVRKREDIKFFKDCAENKNKIVKMISKSRFKNKIEYGEYVEDPQDPNTLDHQGYIGVVSDKKKVELNKPIYLGWAILELSKLFIYEFWYNHIKKIYGANAKLMYQDTDSLVLEVRVPLNGDYYEDVKKHRHLYDLSNCGTDPTKPIHYIS
jgi:hypothetical protein